MTVLITIVTILIVLYVVSMIAWSQYEISFKPIILTLYWLGSKVYLFVPPLLWFSKRCGYRQYELANVLSLSDEDLRTIGVYLINQTEYIKKSQWHVLHLLLVLENEYGKDFSNHILLFWREGFLVISDLEFTEDGKSILTLELRLSNYGTHLTRKPELFKDLMVADLLGV